MPLTGQLTEVVIATLAASIEAMSGEMDRIKAERDDALDKLKYAREALSNIETERNELFQRGLEQRKMAEANRRDIATLNSLADDLQGRVRDLSASHTDLEAKLARANGHNDLLRDQNSQLQAALKRAQVRLERYQGLAEPTQEKATLDNQPTEV